MVDLKILENSGWPETPIPFPLESLSVGRMFEEPPW